MSNPNKALVQVHLAVFLFGLSGLFGKFFGVASYGHCFGTHRICQFSFGMVVSQGAQIFPPFPRARPAGPDAAGGAAGLSLG